MNYKNPLKTNLSRGMKPHEVQSKSDIRKYCVDHNILPPAFSAKLKTIFIQPQSFTYWQHQALLEMASKIGYVCKFEQVKAAE